MQQGMLQASFVLEVVWHLAQWPNTCETFPARIFTSGTTGNPKAVRRSLSAHVMSAQQFSDPCQTSFHGKLFGHFVRDTMRKRTTDGRRCIRPRQVNDWKSLAAGQHKRGCNPPTFIFDIWLSPKLGMQIGNVPRLRSSSLNRLPIWRNSGHARRVFHWLVSALWFLGWSLFLDFVCLLERQPSQPTGSHEELYAILWLYAKSATPDRSLTKWDRYTVYGCIWYNYMYMKRMKGVFVVLQLLRGFLSVDSVQARMRPRRQAHMSWWRAVFSSSFGARMGQVY